MRGTVRLPRRLVNDETRLAPLPGNYQPRWWLLTPRLYKMMSRSFQLTGTGSASCPVGGGWKRMQSAQLPPPNQRATADVAVLTNRFVEVHCCRDLRCKSSVMRERAAARPGRTSRKPTTKCGATLPLGPRARLLPSARSPPRRPRGRPDTQSRRARARAQGQTRLIGLATRVLRSAKPARQRYINPPTTTRISSITFI